MGRHRSPNTSDEVYALRRARYIENREENIARGKKRYAEIREHLLLATRYASRVARAQRLEAKRAKFYLERGQDIPGTPLEKTRAYVHAIKSTTPCTDCRKSYPACVMDFDHVRGTKVADISTLMAKGRLNACKEEIAKCEVVCANCHRLRTDLRSK